MNFYLKLQLREPNNGEFHIDVATNLSFMGVHWGGQDRALAPPGQKNIMNL